MRQHEKLESEFGREVSVKVAVRFFEVVLSVIRASSIVPSGSLCSI